MVFVLEGGSYLSVLLIYIVFLQTSHGSSSLPYFHLLEEKVKEVYLELMQPLILETTQGNETITSIEEDYLKRILTNPSLNLVNNTNNFSSKGDSCQKLAEYLPKAKKKVETAFYICSNITSAMSQVVLDSFDCLSINIFKTITCLLGNVGKTLSIYRQFKPEIRTIILELKSTLSILIELYKNCLRHI